MRARYVVGGWECGSRAAAKFYPKNALAMIAPKCSCCLPLPPLVACFRFEPSVLIVFAEYGSVTCSNEHCSS